MKAKLSKGVRAVSAVLAGVVSTVAGSASADSCGSRFGLVGWGRWGAGSTWSPVRLASEPHRPRSIAVGADHAVVLQEDGSVTAWGSNGSGQVSVPAGLPPVRSVSAGDSHSVAALESGAVVCWGMNAYGQCTVPAGLAGVTGVAAGGYHTIAVRSDGTVACWGMNSRGQCTPPAGLGNVHALAAGFEHSVALGMDGSVTCWGSNGDGQTSVPVGLGPARAIAAGTNHTIAARADGTVACWGANYQGQCTPPTGLDRVISVAGGLGHSVALREDGSVVGWGFAGGATVPADLGPARMIAAGQSGTMAVRMDGVVRAWGTWRSQGTLVVPKDPGLLVVIASGTGHAVAATADGKVRCWGSNSNGQGLAPASLDEVIGVGAGEFHSLAVRANGQVVCWGSNSVGQGSVPADLPPAAIVRAGYFHSISIGVDASIRCWGFNDFGQCTVPPGVVAVRDAAGGRYFTLAARTDGTVAAWGRNDFGQCTVPPGLDLVTHVAAGEYHSLALRSDGSVRAWGFNGYGQSTIPPDLPPVTAIAGGATYSLALRLDGTIATWGSDPGGYGVLVPPAAEGPFTAISSGIWHGLAIPVAVDTDGDSVADPADNCPCVANAGQSDLDGDGAGDACDQCPGDFAKALPGTCGCGTPDVDMNGNWELDCLEIVDSDGDGVPDDLDGCPNDANKTSPGVCGCGEVERDLDNDQRIDCLEAWVPDPAFIASEADGEADDRFGSAVATDDTWLAVGSPGDDAGRGSVRMFGREASAWVERQRLVAPVPVAGDAFGSCVALDGDLLAIGSPGGDPAGRADAGKVELFRLVAGTWIHEATLTRPVPAAGDAFGSSVGVRGNLVAGGAPRADRGGAIDSGEACVFVGVSGGLPGAWIFASASGSVPSARDDRYGTALDFTATAGPPLLAVGAPRDDQPQRLNCGAIYLVSLTDDGLTVAATRLTSPASRTNAELGTSVAIDAAGETAAAGGPLADLDAVGDDAGFATIWTRSGVTWFGGTVFATVPEAGARFGASVDLDPTGALLVVGSPRRTLDGTSLRGHATLFRRYGGGSWDLGTALDDGAGGTTASHFGSAVAVGSTVLVSGGPMHAPPEGGAVAVFAAPVSCVGEDADGDGLADACDACPEDAAKVLPGTCGCGVPESDADGDGTADCHDGCPADPAKTAPGSCGCGVPDIDTDLDTLLDCVDPDDDDDGVPDGSDGCPVDPSKSEPGLCGCGVAETDYDEDGTPACLDACDEDPAKIEPGTCGCRVPDDDLDADGLVDCLGRGTLDETAAVVAPDSLAGDDFGASIAFDGTALVLGSPLDDVAGRTDAGSVAIFTRDELGDWTLRQRLTPPVVQARASFGASVALDPETGALVIGAPFTDLGGLADAGAAYRYRPDGSGTWALADTLNRTGPAAGDLFGQSVAARGGLVAVAAPKANALGLADSGEATVYREEAGQLVIDLVRTGESAGDLFGQSIAIAAGSAHWELVAGVPGDDEGAKSNCGGVHVLAIVDGGGRTRLLAPTPIRNAGLGTSLAIGGGGGMLAAGAPLADLPDVGTDCGQVIVWTFSGTAWSGVEARPADHVAGERLGTSVAISDDTDWLVAGAPYDTVGGIPQRGSAALLARVGSSWVTFDRLTLPPEGASASRFGTAAVLRADRIMIGAPKHTPPAGGTVREFIVPPP